MPRRLLRYIIPRTVRSELRRTLDAALDAKAATYGLFLATGQSPALHDRAAMAERYVGHVVRLLERIVGETTGRNGDEQAVLPFAPA